MLAVIKLQYLIHSLQQMQRKEMIRISRKKGSVFFFPPDPIKDSVKYYSLSVLALTGDVE